MQPIKQHKRFIQVGRAFAQLAKVVAVLDLPEKLTFPTNRPVLLAGNHRSFFDLLPAMIIFSKFGLSARILIRGDLMQKGPAAKFFWSIGCIPASRELRAESEAMAIEALKNGELVCLMPEGRLVKPEDRPNGVGSARPGVSRIACASGAVVIPVAYAGSEKVWPRGGSPRLQWPRPRVKLRLGEPIDFATDDHEANTAQVMDVIAAMLKTME